MKLPQVISTTLNAKIDGGNNMQKYRKIIQFIFFFAMFIIPLLNLAGIYFIKGTYISLDVGALSFSDPIAVFQALLLSHTVKAVMIASIAIPLLIVLFFGRIWCSWGCPYYLILDWFEELRKKLKLKPLKRGGTKFSQNANIFRFVFFVGGIFLVAVAGIPLLYLFSPPSVLSSQAILIIKYFTVTFEFLIIPILLVLEFFFFYRFWCRFFCPTGTCLSIFQNKRGMKISYSGSCSQCLKCVKACPMVIDPRKDGESTMCNNCGVCVSVCGDNKKNKTLFYKIN